MPDLRFRFYPHLRPSILEVMREWASIDFEPAYQRKGDLWDERRRQYFIDSIINGVDLSKLYFHELTEPREEDGRTIRYGVVDGKQRLQAIRKFVSDELRLAGDFEFMHGPGNAAGGKRYSDLLEEFPVLRARFDDTVLPIVLIHTEDEGLIEGLFLRLNEGITLNAAEKRNAFGGPIPIAIRDLVGEPFFERTLPFDDGRYRHRDLAAKYLWITREGRFVSTKKNDLDEFVKEYRAKPHLADTVSDLLSATRKILDRMALFFRAQDPLLEGVGWATLGFHLFRLTNSATLPKPFTRDMLARFASEVTENRHRIRALADGKLAPNAATIDSDLTQFDGLRQSPNDATALKTRYVILARYLERTFSVTLPDAGP